MQHRHLLLFAAAFGIIFSANYFMMKSLEREGVSGTLTTPSPQATSPARASRPLDTEPGTVKKRPQQQDLSKYGIISVKKEELPKTQDEWNLYMKKVIEEKKLFESEQGQEALELMKTTPEEFEKSMERADRQLEKLRQMQAEDPLNEEIEEKIQNLYRAKAMGEALKGKVLTPPSQ